MFQSMLRIRLIEQVIADRYQENEMKSPVHLAIGQEGVAVGSCMGLRCKDQVFCGHRTHAVYLAKGGCLKAMMSELHCRINGCAASRGGSMHLIDKKAGVAGSSAIVAGIVPIATGAALAAKQQGDDRMTIVFLGDAAVEEGVFWESINFAKLKNLPILYLCENNYYSVCSPLEFRQFPGVEIYNKVGGFGLNTYSIDGNNVLEVRQTTSEAIALIARGEGPVFIEAHTYRWMGHHGDREDSHLGYRSPEELDEWKQADPVHLFLHALKESGHLVQQHYDKMVQEIQDEIKEAFEHALSSPFPTEMDLLTHVYA
jgi:pyruvate dehydrogenase E1 component alpha subunit